MTLHYEIYSQRYPNRCSIPFWFITLLVLLPIQCWLKTTRRTFESRDHPPCFFHPPQFHSDATTEREGPAGNFTILLSRVDKATGWECLRLGWIIQLLSWKYAVYKQLQSFSCVTCNTTEPTKGLLSSVGAASITKHETWKKTHTAEHRHMQSKGSWEINHGILLAITALRRHGDSNTRICQHSPSSHDDWQAL